MKMSKRIQVAGCKMLRIVWEEYTNMGSIEAAYPMSLLMNWGSFRLPKQKQNNLNRYINKHFVTRIFKEN